MKVLVLGGYGLIGREITRQLLYENYEVVGLGRSAVIGERLLPKAQWRGCDLNHLTHCEDWSSYLQGVQVVINASGALQSGGRDNLKAAQFDAICALIRACERNGISTFVQISAPGACPWAKTEFLSTKGKADQVLRASTLNWVIFKPGLVLSSTAYGGTSFLRMLAAVPFVLPLVLSGARLQTVDVKDVARAVLRSLRDPSLFQQNFDLVETRAHTLCSIVLSFRQWLGFSPPLLVVKLPLWLGFAFGRVADMAGLLGWRAPLRTTALKILADDVLGNPEPWKAATGETLKSLPETLEEMPSTVQERLFARMQLLFPVLVAGFVLFWIFSGLIGLWRLDAASAFVAPVVGAAIAKLAVISGCLLDFFVGIGLLFRKSFKAGCRLAILVSLIYLVSGTVLTPELWADPLGPLLKIIPVLGLSLVLLAMAEER